MDITEFRSFVNDGNAIRRVLRLQPVGGIGDYVAPPTYKDGDQSVHVFEERRISDQNVSCVLLDSVQSQANRFEEALTKAIKKGDIKIPHMVVDFTKNDFTKDVGIITSINAPHRIFDAIIRDSILDKKNFPESPIGTEINMATVNNATALLSYSPTTLLFGGWNSTSESGGIGPRFQRCIVSEIIGIGVAKSKKTSSRIDPLQISKDIKLNAKDKIDWELNPKGKNKPSEISHGNIPPTINEQGVTMDYALQTTVVTVAGLRNLSFPVEEKCSEEYDLAAWTILAALAIYAIIEQDKNGYSLRSRCDLIPETQGTYFEFIHNNGKIEEIKINKQDVDTLLKDSIKSLKNLGLLWEDEPKELIPQKKLVDLIKESQNRLLTKD